MKTITQTTRTTKTAKPQPIDLLTFVERGGCSAKIPPQVLEGILKGLPLQNSAPPVSGAGTIPGGLLVGAETRDDAAVWKINDETAIIQTTDFFPPVCSAPYDFGRVAAANAMSDIFAMGGNVLLALNLVMFPSSRLDIAVLEEILRGGGDKVAEAGGIVGGGHTIDDFPPKYGLAVTGVVHPDRVITNCRAATGDLLILTKALGTGAIINGYRKKEAPEVHYRGAVDSMITLNRAGAQLMQKHGIICATDITGFSLLGHALEMAEGSNKMIRIDASRVPRLPGALELIAAGLVPCAARRNLKYVEEKTGFSPTLDDNLKMLLLDAQTSGGLLIACPPQKAEALTLDLKAAGYNYTEIIGAVGERTGEPSFLNIK